MDNSHNPLVSIIVATKNEQARLPHLCLSIAKQNYTNIETIIVDNYSTDDTLILAKRFTQKVYLHVTETTEPKNQRVNTCCILMQIWNFIRVRSENALRLFPDKTPKH